MTTTLFAVVIIIAWLWLGLSALPAGLEARMPLPYMIALTPFLWVPLIVLAGVAVWQHEWGAMCLLIVAALMTSSQRISYWGTGLTAGKRRETLRETSSGNAGRTAMHTGKANDSNVSDTNHAMSGAGVAPNAPTPPENRETWRETSYETLPPQFAVMTLNCRYGRANADAIVTAVRERRITVLALQEVTDALIARLDKAGIGELLPYRQSGNPQDTDNGGYNVILSRYEPAAAVPNVVDIPAADVPAITLRLAGGNAQSNKTALANSAVADQTDTASTQPERTVTFCSAHPKSPMRGCADWSAGILGLGAIARASVIGDHNIAVVLGDLNSSTDHPSFRALLKSGFKDASLTQAAGPTLTFPRWIPWPRIELDHILFTPGLNPSGVQSFEIPDTDHLALTATLALREC